MPYDREEKMVTPQMWRNIFMHAIFQIVVLMVILFLGHEIFGVPYGIGIELEDWDATTGQHLTIFFDVFVYLQVFNFFNARKLKKEEINVFENIFNNMLFLLIVIGIFVLQLFIVQFGGKSMKLVPLNMEQHLICILLGATALVDGVIIKQCIPNSCFEGISWLKETTKPQRINVDKPFDKLQHFIS